MEISPKYQMQLIQNIESALWDLYETSKYKNVFHYIQKWQKITWYWFHNEEECNFNIKWKSDGSIIDLSETLHSINDSELLLQIANDLWVATPWFIPVVSEMKQTLETNYQTSFSAFQKAQKNIYEDPGMSIGLANSALESIIKHILEDSRISVIWSKKQTLYDLTQAILKEFGLFPWKSVPKEISQLWSWLMSISQSIEWIRSDKTLFHWKTDSDNLVKESMYAFFIINSVSTIGLFFIHFYEANYPRGSTQESIKEEEISIEDTPF
jgi:hypothetical protein